MKRSHSEPNDDHEKRVREWLALPMFDLKPKVENAQERMFWYCNRTLPFDAGDFYATLTALPLTEFGSTEDPLLLPYVTNSKDYYFMTPIYTSLRHANMALVLEFWKKGIPFTFKHVNGPLPMSNWIEQAMFITSIERRALNKLARKWMTEMTTIAIRDILQLIFDYCPLPIIHREARVVLPF